MSGLVDAFRKQASPKPTEELWRKTPYSQWGLADLKTREPVGRTAPASGSLPEGLDLWIETRADGSVAFAVSETLRTAGVEIEFAEPGLDESSTQPYYRELEKANAALAGSEIRIRIPDGVAVEKPIEVLFELGERYAFPRLNWVLGKGASATLVESYRGENAAKAIAFSRATLGEGAAANIFYAQNLGSGAVHFWNGSAVLDRDARLSHGSVVLGGKTHKSNLRVELRGPGASAELRGLSFGDGRQHLDLQTNQIHSAPSCFSDLKYVGALQGKARSLFTGGIWVGEKALQTEAFQENRNLLLSEEARADSTPILEILTDAVRCKHGATAGKLSDAELFYLQTRGLSKDEARRMLVMGFFEPVLAALPVPDIREELGRTIAGRLG